MKVENIDVGKSIKSAEDILEKDTTVSFAVKTAIKLLITIITILVNRLNLNSSNSSKPPSSDPNREKKKRAKSKKKPGGQNGHEGSTLKPVSNPDEIIDLSIDKQQLPQGKKFEAAGYIARQVVDIKIYRHITEYRAEALRSESGEKYVAEFPYWITRPIQYGTSVKIEAVNFSAYQLVPYKRIQEQFQGYNIPISTGTIYSFNEEAASLLRTLGFENIAKQALINSEKIHSDETGINLNGKKQWLHSASNEQWSWFEAHEKRGTEAMEAIGILPNFKGLLVHDHWKPYFKYGTKHSLCNAHHLRELIRAYEQDNQEWAQKMLLFLEKLNDEVNQSVYGMLINPDIIELRKAEYRKILEEGKFECPLPPKEKGKRVRKGKSRNLLERLEKYEDETLRFMYNPIAPFTNNQGERDIRMNIVQQKISGCFRGEDGMKNSLLIRSYISTCIKNNMSAHEALEVLFNKRLPDFMQNEYDTS